MGSSPAVAAETVATENIYIVHGSISIILLLHAYMTKNNPGFLKFNFTQHFVSCQSNTTSNMHHADYPRYKKKTLYATTCLCNYVPNVVKVEIHHADHA